jgi:hypothetical protein
VLSQSPFSNARLDRGEKHFRPQDKVASVRPLSTKLTLILNPWAESTMSDISVSLIKLDS